MKLAEYFHDLITRGLERFNLYYSSYRGIVVDNADPDHLHRIKVQVPQVTGDYTIEYWAWPKGNPSSNSTGFQLLPKKGEMVWVEFEFGNPRRPIWTYGYRGTEDFIEDELKPHDLVWFRTKSGHKIVIDDINGFIRVESGSGKVIEIGENISIGSRTESAQSAVLGQTLVQKLETILDILQNAKVNTSIGPQPFLPNTITDLLNVESELEEVLSEVITID